MYPEARQDRLLVEAVLDELVVYEQDRDRVHRLNRTAALVWRHCDGRTSIAALAALLQQELGIAADEALVWLALDRLEKAHLLTERLARPAEMAAISRREAVRRLGLGAAAAVLLPVITSIAAPTPAMAQYGAECPSVTPIPGAPDAGITLEAGGNTAADALANFVNLVRATCDPLCTPFNGCGTQQCKSIGITVPAPVCGAAPPGFGFPFSCRATGVKLCDCRCS